MWTFDHIHSVVFLWIPRGQNIFFGKADQIDIVLGFLEGVEKSCFEEVALAYHYYILWAFLQFISSDEPWKRWKKTQQQNNNHFLTNIFNDLFLKMKNKSWSVKDIVTKKMNFK